MKKILFLLSISFTLLASPFSNIKDVRKVLELSKKTDLFVEGKIVESEALYYHRVKKILIDEVNEKNISNILVVTKFKVKILEKFNDNIKEKNEIIDVWTPGGYLYLNGEKVFQGRSHAAFANMEEGDILILGLVKIKESKSSMFNNGYKLFENSTKLQIPSSEKMIREVEEGELKKAERKVYLGKLRAMEEEGSDEFPSYEELRSNSIKAEIAKEDNIKAKTKFVEDIKSSLRREYE